MKAAAIAVIAAPLIATSASGQILYLNDFETITSDFIDADSFLAIDGAPRSGTAIFAASETLTISSGIIDASMLPGAQVDFSWAAVGVTGPGDFLDVSVNGTSVFSLTGSALRPGADGFRSPDPIDISAFVGGDIEVVWTLSSGSFSSFVILDNALVEVIPAPATLITLGGMGLLGRRRG